MMFVWTLITVAVALVGAIFYGGEFMKGEGRKRKFWLEIVGLFMIMAALIAREEIGEYKAKGSPPADITQLDNGVYAVNGEMRVGDEVALWLAPPIDSPKDFEHGKFYKLPKDAKKDFGPYVKKLESGELLAYQFEK